MRACADDAIVYLYSDMTASLCNEMKGVLSHFVAQ